MIQGNEREAKPIFLITYVIPNSESNPNKNFQVKPFFRNANFSKFDLKIPYSNSAVTNLITLHLITCKTMGQPTVIKDVDPSLKELEMDFFALNLQIAQCKIPHAL